MQVCSTQALFLLVVLAASSTSADVALAQPSLTPQRTQVGVTTPPNANQRLTQAKAYFAEGKAAEAAGNHVLAAILYEKAYELEPIPMFLFNLGQVSRWAGRNTVALDYYRRFLETHPPAEFLNAAKELVAEVEHEIAVQRASENEHRADTSAHAKQVDRTTDAAPGSERAAPKTSQPYPAPSIEAKRAHDTASAQATIAVVGGLGSVHPSSSGMTVRRKMALGVGIMAGISIGAALAFELSGREAYGEYKQEQTRALYDRANSRHHLAQGLAIAGVACAAAGVTLWVTGAPARRARTTTAAPFIASDAVGVSVTGGF